jgi:hypothetical protein
LSVRRLAGPVVLTLALVLSTVPAHAGLADRIGDTFLSMVDEVVRVFHPMEGVVVRVDGDVVYLDLGATDASVGQELTVFRKGAAFTHPVTGKVLGQYEDVLGYAQIRKVSPRFSEAVFVPTADKSRPIAEDGARITRGRIKLAITPPIDLTVSGADLRRVPYLMATALERSKRFSVLDPLAVSDLLASGSVRVEEVLARPERAVRVAKNLGVAAWLVPIVLERGGVTYLDVTWVSAVTGTALLSRRQALMPAGVAEEQRFPWEPRAED